jgi:hypothetical protein
MAQNARSKMTCIHAWFRWTRIGPWPLLLACLLLFGRVSAAQVLPLKIDSAQQSQSMNGHVELLFDKSGSLQLDDIRASSEWVDIGNQPYSKGLEEGVAWLRFRVENPTDESIERVIQVNHGLADQATAWLIGTHGMTRFEAG